MSSTTPENSAAGVADGDGDEDGDALRQAKGSPELYARRILAFAKRSAAHSLYPGKHYSSLARLLISPYQSYGEEGRLQIAESSTDFIHLYDLDTNRQGRKIAISNVQSLDRYDDETRKMQSSGRLLFMEGYPSPQWLNHIGSKFDIDPEFFFRHLEFDQLQRNPSHFFMFSLPSVATIIRIRMTSILSRDGFHFEPEQTVADLRNSCDIHMAEYLSNLVKSLKVSVSESIVRRFSVHDKQHFSIEQMVTICVAHNTPGWMAFIWLDHGKDLSHSSTGPWKALQQNSRTSCSLTVLPTIQYLSRIALKRQPTQQAGIDSLPTQNAAHSLPQNSTCLTNSYGRSLRPEIMECDAFYALDELFRFAIASESQFLEMMKHKISAATITGGGSRIEDLSAALDLLEDHRQYISETLEVVRVGGHPNWPKAPDKLRKKAIVARERLESDYEYLLKYAERLSEKCVEGIKIMMNDAMLHQSQQAIEQSEATMKLTFLAFLFAPLSFTTSFFSMQVREIENKGLSIWIWCLFTFALLAISFCFWRWRPQALLRRLWMTISSHRVYSVPRY